MPAALGRGGRLALGARRDERTARAHADHAHSAAQGRCRGYPPAQRRDQSEIRAILRNVKGTGIDRSRRAFGPRAERTAALLPEVDAIFCDVRNLADAYPSLVQARTNGELFYGMLLWDDPRSAVAFELAVSLLAQYSHIEERQAVFDALAAGTLKVNTSAVTALRGFDARTVTLAAELTRYASAQLFFSHEERERFARDFGRRAQGEIAYAAHRLPDFHRASPVESTVVIWAPDLQASQTALLAFAFEEWRGDVYVVCAGGGPPPLRARYLDGASERVAELLASAALVVDASLSDPGAALAFAQREIPLLTPATNGAHDLIRGNVVYAPWDWRSVFFGALRACGRPTELRAPPRVLPPTLAVSDLVRTSALPLASIVVTT